MLRTAIAALLMIASAPALAQTVQDQSDKNLSDEDAAAVIHAASRDAFDAESARFLSLNYMQNEDGPVKQPICGFMNAKNRMGGYVGYQPFVYNVADKKAFFMPDAVAEQPGAKETFVKMVEAMGCPRP